MHMGIKETKTLAELKEIKEYLELRAKELYKSHKKASENWQFGDIDKIWIDKDGYICIEYENGDWLHYNDNGEWW